jgi:hypothetical protein
MSEPNVLVNFRLDKDQPLRLRWLATDGVPGNGYKAQITAVKLSIGKLPMDGSAIMEHTETDPDGGLGAYLMTFNGMVGFAAGHPDRELIDKLTEEEIDYELAFVHDDTGRLALEGTDYTIVERPRAWARKLA